MTSMCMASEGHKPECDRLTEIIERDRANVHESLVGQLSEARALLERFNVEEGEEINALEYALPDIRAFLARTK